ncbi:MAG: serine/threonine protein kinase [Deltaproteobacteria bacterium]|nr:serine/threonine protein kinase [Deltaproteobacteria bacterium]
MDEPREGDVVETYVLERRLGTGGHASVWEASDSNTGTRVALKLLHTRFRVSARARGSFRRETDVLGALEHPSIAKCLGFRLDVDQPWLAMELVPGHTLRDEMARRTSSGQTFEIPIVVDVVRQLAKAVDHAHGRGIVHRDLKPANVMVRSLPAGILEVKVLDFGVAKILEASPSDATTQGNTFGTLMYMSPEQAAGARVGRETDVFSLAVLTFELLTLTRPWAVDELGKNLQAYLGPLKMSGPNSPAHVLRRICAEERPSVSAYRDLPEALDLAVQRALAIRAEDRFSTAGAFAAAVEAAALHRRRGVVPVADATWTDSGPTIQDRSPSSGPFDGWDTQSDSDDAVPSDLDARPRLGSGSRLIAPVLRSDLSQRVFDPADHPTTLDIRKPSAPHAVVTTVPESEPMAAGQVPEVRSPIERSASITDPDPPLRPLRAPPAPAGVAPPSRSERLHAPPAPAGSGPVTDLPTVADVRVRQLRMMVAMLIVLNVVLISAFVAAWLVFK